MIETTFTRLVGCSVPIQVAPMGAVSTPELIAVTAGAGAFPMIGTAGMTPAQVSTLLDAVAALTAAPIGANMLMPFADPAIVEAVAPRVRVFDFFHGEPDIGLVKLVHEAGALAGWQACSRAEALAAVDAGCDLIAARGVEGGGRMYGDQPLLPLLNDVLAAVDVPVLAAGGLATARDVAAVLAMGAAGARIGTRFVATHESGAHPLYKQAIVDADAADAVLVTDFSVLWPNGPEPHRVLRQAIDAANRIDGDTVGEVVMGGEAHSIPKFAVMPPVAGMTGTIEAFAMYAGTSVGSIHAIAPAGDVVRELADGAEALLRAP